MREAEDRPDGDQNEEAAVRNGRRAFCGFVVLLAVVLGAPPVFGQADLSVTAVNQTCDPCNAGQRATIVNTVTNLGPDPDPDVAMQLATAALSTEVVADSWSTDVGQFDVDPSGNPVFLDDAGLAYIMLVSGAVMTAGLTGTVTYQVDLAMEPPSVSDLTVNSPPDLAGPWEHRGGAFGQPFQSWDTTADLEWVNDGSSLPTQGCGALIGFTPGNIALIDRGNCEFGLKALGAEAVGASAAIIVNNDPAQPLSGILMGAGEFGSEVTVPALMITYDDGAILRQRILVLGETVNASVRHVPSVGPLEPWVVSSEPSGFPSMWAFGNNDPDCCPLTDPDFPNCCSAATNTDNLVYLSYTVTPVVFTDGFESGDLLAWSLVYP